MTSTEQPTTFQGEDVDLGSAPEGQELTPEEESAIRASQDDPRTPDRDDQEVG